MIHLPGRGRRRFHAIWLRDNAWDEATRAPGNGQRLITLGDIPGGTRIAEARLEAGQLQVTFQPEDRSIAFDLGWLADRAYDRTVDQVAGWTAPEIETWGATLGARIPIGDFALVSRDQEALRKWLHGVRRFKVADLFGYVRETNYGRHFEVRTEVNPSNHA